MAEPVIEQAPAERDGEHDTVEVDDPGASGAAAHPGQLRLSFKGSQGQVTFGKVESPNCS